MLDMVRRRINPQEDVYIPEKDYDLCLLCRNAFCFGMKPEKCWNIWTKSMAQTAYNMIISGKGCCAVSKKFGIGHKRIIRLLNKSGYNMEYARKYIKKNNRCMRQQDIERAFNLYVEFKSFSKVSEFMKFLPATIANNLKKYEPFIEYKKGV